MEDLTSITSPEWECDVWPTPDGVFVTLLGPQERVHVMRLPGSVAIAGLVSDILVPGLLAEIQAGVKAPEALANMRRELELILAERVL